MLGVRDEASLGYLRVFDVAGQAPEADRARLDPKKYGTFGIRKISASGWELALTAEYSEVRFGSSMFTVRR